MSPPYQPRDDCPKRLQAPPCPLYGGPIPELEPGPPVGSFANLDDLIEKGSSYLFGRCGECGEQVMFDDDDRPLRALHPR